MADEPQIGDVRRAQRDHALAVANAVRKRRAELKEAMKRGEVDPVALVAGTLEEYEPDIARWRVEQLLRSLPGIGPATMQEILLVFRASPTQKVSAFSYERRQHLARLVAQALGREK